MLARPNKEGLNYFPLDVDIDQDDKIALIEAAHGLEGFGVVIKLLMKIYHNSYFYKWEEKEQLLFSRRVNVHINRVNDIINDCTKWDLFSFTLYEQHRVLTSKGIQKRYLEATTRRKEVTIYSEYLLLSELEVNEYKNLVIVDINSLNDDINTQSKVKESKEYIYIDFPIDGSLFLNIYNQQFKKKFNKSHMRVTEDNAQFILDNISKIESQMDTEDFERITEYHFQHLPESNNGNILAFIQAFKRYVKLLNSDETNWNE